MNPLPPENTDDDSWTFVHEKPVRRRGFLPWWLWALAAIVLVMIGFIFVVPLLSGSKTGNSDPILGGSPSASATMGPSASANVSPSPAVTVNPNLPPIVQGTFDAGMTPFMSDVLNSQNTSVLSQGGTFNNPMVVFMVNGGQDSNMTPDDAVNLMSTMFTPADPQQWNLSLPDSDLAVLRSGPYAEYFPDGAIVAKSADGHVFSFIGDGSTITTMFMMNPISAPQ